MFQKVFSACALALVSLTGVSAFAQTAEPMEISVPGTNIDWAGLVDKLIDQLMTPLGLGIGFAFAIWIVLMGVAALKKTASTK